MEYKSKEVRYDLYCPKCKYKNVAENQEPCWECLTEFVNENSQKPLMFEERGNPNESRRTQFRNHL